MNAYNSVMDTSLQKRYKSEYMKYRGGILPPKGAKHWSEAMSEKIVVIEKSR